MTYTKAVSADLNLKFILSKFHHGFTNRVFLYCAILKALCSFKEKRAQKVREIQFVLQNIQNMVFKILKMFKNNTKFTWAAYWINLKIRNRDKSTAHDIILSLSLVIIIVELSKLFNTVELHFFKSLKVNCSNTVCSSFMRPISNK